MVKFCSIMAKATYIGEEDGRQRFLRFPYRQDFWLDDPEKGWLKPYIHDAFLKFEQGMVKVLPYAYGNEFAVLTVLTDKPIQYIQSWERKMVRNIYVPEHDAYVQIAQIYEYWDHIRIFYEDGSEESIDMTVFQPYRYEERPLKPEQRVDAVRVLIKNPPGTEIPLLF